MSRSLVGSSRISRSAGRSIRRAIRTRACSPPESRETGVSSCSRAEEEPLRPGGDVRARPLVDHRVAVRRERAAQRERAVEALARSARRRPSRSRGARSIAAGVGRERAGEKRQQRRLAAAVGAEHAETRCRGPARGRFRRALADRRSDFASPRASSSALGPSSGGRRSRCSARACPAVRPRTSASSPSRAWALVDPRLRLGGARLRAAAQPLDLAARAVGERLLVLLLVAAAPRRGARADRCSRRRPRGARRA